MRVGAASCYQRQRSPCAKASEYSFLSASENGGEGGERLLPLEASRLISAGLVEVMWPQTRSPALSLISLVFMSEFSFVGFDISDNSEAT